MKGKGKKKVAINKEENSENWCFVCKDGGDIRICDYKQCLKSYHPGCVRKDDSFLESEKKWDCAWHNCFRCRRSSYLHCYTCPNAVCRYCLSAAEILHVKGKYGFCKPCLQLALLIEENKDYDSDGAKVDFTDRETCEGLFMEYYVIIKKQEGFELGDIYAAKDRVKAKKNHQPESGSDEFDEEEEEQISDYDDSEDEKKYRKTRKRSKGHMSAKQKPVKSNKKEFIGWASRSLIEFLNSIGKCTSEKLSQHDVTAIVNEYVKEKKLLHPEKKRMIMCDVQLQPLFRKKTINRSRVFDLLEDHFAENHDESEEDEMGYDSENSNNAGAPNACKRQRKMDVEKKSEEKDVENNVPQSRFASIVVENVKLVYLRRGVLKELLKQPESFEEKVTGCFVRVKSDPYDYRSRSHQLMQVKGVKTVSIDENNTETILLLSAMPKEIRICLLSDEDISEEECEELRKKVLAGEIERPTVEDLQQKVKAIHKDMTNHWIRKELALLKNLIDRANEKGWRRDLFEYLERRKRLQSPSEQSQLLEDVPTVIPDVYEPDSNSGGIKNGVKSDEGSPESILPCNSTVPSDEQHDKKASEENTQHVHHTSPSEKGQRISEKSATEEPQHGHTRNKVIHPIENRCSEKMLVDRQAKPKGSNIEVIDIISVDDDDDSKASRHVIANQETNDLENEVWCLKGPNGERNKSSLSVLRRWSENSAYASRFKVWKEDESEEDAIPLPEAIRLAFRRT